MMTKNESSTLCTVLPNLRPSGSLRTMISFLLLGGIFHSGVQGFTSSWPCASTTASHSIVSPPAQRTLPNAPLTLHVPSAGSQKLTRLRVADVASPDSHDILSRWTTAKNLGQTLKITLAEPLSASVGVLQHVPPSLSTARRILTKALRRYWWSLPLLLCLVPLYTCAVHKCPPATPGWWKLTNLDHLWHSNHSPVDAAHTSSLLSLFLVSNVSYFIGGIYLLQQYPLLLRERHDTRFDTALSHSPPGSSRGAMLPLLGSWLGSSRTFRSRVPSGGTWLAVWLLLAGSVSTLFHAVQAFGEYSVAEGWCYLDHGVAIAATLYFAHYCHAPRTPALILGLIGVAALALPLPGYLGWHSAWHFVSAGAAVLWATQPKARRRAALESTRIVAAAQSTTTPPPPSLS